MGLPVPSGLFEPVGADSVVKETNEVGGANGVDAEITAGDLGDILMNTVL